MRTKTYIYWNFWALKDILLLEAQSYTEFKSFCKKEQSSTFEIPWYNLVSSAKLTILELSWSAFKWICANFLGNNMYHAYRNGVEKLLDASKEMVCRMSLKMQFLHSPLELFPENLGAVSDEQGERFHQDILTMEVCYQRFWNESMMAGHCWMLYRENPDQMFKRK